MLALFLQKFDLANINLTAPHEPEEDVLSAEDAFRDAEQSKSPLADL